MTALLNALQRDGSVRALFFGGMLSILVFTHPTTAHTSTLQNVINNGDVRCGVFPNVPGRSAIDPSGDWKGFYVDFCRATAAAVLGDPNFVDYVEVDYKSRFTSLQNNQTDVVMFSTTWSVGRELKYNVSFPTIYLFDGLGVLVRNETGIKTFADLQGKSACVVKETTSTNNFRQELQKRGITMVFKNLAYADFYRGRCDVIIGDKMNLASSRADQAEDISHYTILPDILTREPIGPMVRDNDAQWSRIIRVIVHAMILAEDYGLTQNNIENAMKTKGLSEVNHLLGLDGDLAAGLGLPKDWAYRVIKSVGNYGDVFNRHFGPKTRIGAPRGLNKSWSQGGLLFAPIFR